jgi:translation initiation factor IF-2
MMIEKYRVHEVAKDLNLPTKEVVDLLAANFEGKRKSMTALNEEELSVVLNITPMKQGGKLRRVFAAGEAKKAGGEGAAERSRVPPPPRAAAQQRGASVGSAEQAPAAEQHAAEPSAAGQSATGSAKQAQQQI